MFEDPRPSVREHLRDLLGTTAILTRIHGLETDMAKVIDLLNGLVAQQTAASAAQATSFHNIDVAFANLQRAIDNQDQANPEVQTAVDQLAAGFASLQKSAEDEGRVYAPQDGQPADGSGLPADGDQTVEVPAGDVPAEPTQEVPAESAATETKRGR